MKNHSKSILVNALWAAASKFWLNDIKKFCIKVRKDQVMFVYNDLKFWSFYVLFKVYGMPEPLSHRICFDWILDSILFSMIKYKNDEKDIFDVLMNCILRKFISFTNLYYFETFHCRYLKHCMFLTFSWCSLIEGKCFQSIFDPYRMILSKINYFTKIFVL